MSSTAITTVTRMMESLPETTQHQVADYVRDYIQELQDEMKWDASFRGRQSQIVDAARRAKQEIAEGRATPMDSSQL